MQLTEKRDAWLEISLGSESDHQAASAEFSRFSQFYKQKGASFGYTAKDPSELSSDDAESLLELYNSDPNFSKQGPARTVAPKPLSLGKLHIELFTDVPKASANFKALCTGEKGKASVKGKMLHYKGVKFHRIIRGTLCQGGDIIRGDGSAGESIYGPKFNDEKEGLKHKHDAAGILSMANSGKNSNSSQFFFTQAALPQLDGKHVVFGRVTKGLDILKQLDTQAASVDGKPLVDVWISDCGV